MKVTTPKFSFTIADKAINNLAENPFKFPKPSNVKPRMDAGNGRIKPNVSFSFMMEFLYTESMRHMLKKFKQNMLDTFDKLEDGTQFSAFKCGNTTLKQTFYIYPWLIQCNLVSLNGNMTATDIDVLLAQIQDGKPLFLEKDFALEVISAEWKYRAKTEPLQVKGADLNTQRTK